MIGRASRLLRGLGLLAREGRSGGRGARWLSILLAGAPSRAVPRVSYGHDRLPAPGDVAGGGLAKMARLAVDIQSCPRRFNLLYLGSSSLPPDWPQLLILARAKRAGLVWNQDGVAYPGWHGPGWEESNAPLKRLLQAADHVFYQSRFCKHSADRWVGEPRGPWDVLYNAVDTTTFRPDGATAPPPPLWLLAAGSQHAFYRIESALAALARLVRNGLDTRLRVAGRLAWAASEREGRERTLRVAGELGVADRVELVGPYALGAAPALFRSAHLLLHTKYADPCPTVVLEALASGLPVVYSASGGVPELVADEAGAGVSAPADWDRDHPPDSEGLAAAVRSVASRLAAAGAAARRSAIERFDWRPWVARHREVFAEVLRRLRSRPRIWLGR